MENKLNFRKRTRRSIANVVNLLAALDVTESELTEFKLLRDEDKYSAKEVVKSDGSIRTVYAPHPLVRKLQRRINRRIFSIEQSGRWISKNRRKGSIIWPSYLYGSVPNDQYDNIVVSKDYVACAANHCGCRAVLKLDIGSFFDNVEEQHVYSVFSKLLRFPPDVCNQLVKICCHNGHLVQGALTSSYIASAVLFDVEPLVVSRLHKKGLVYTRLVDDITVSSRDVNYDFSFAESIILDMLSSKDLPVNNAKTTIIKASTSEILIHGLRVSFSEPRLPSSEVSRIRASVQNIESLSRIADYRVSRDYRTSFNRCLGRVNKLARLGHKQHKTLLERINRIPPLPSKSDIKRLDKYISKLEAWYLDNNDEYWYRRLYYKACYDLSILNRSFPCVASEYKLRMKAIRPLYVD